MIPYKIISICRTHIKVFVPKKKYTILSRCLQYLNSFKLIEINYKIRNRAARRLSQLSRMCCASDRSVISLSVQICDPTVNYFLQSHCRPLDHSQLCPNRIKNKKHGIFRSRAFSILVFLYFIFFLI